MEWGRIGKYFVIIWFVSLSVGFICGFCRAAALASVAPNQEDGILAFSQILQGLMMLVSLSVVATRFALRLKEKVLISTSLLFALSWLSSFPINVIWLKQPVAAWIAGGFACPLVAFIGWGCAIPLRKIAARKAAQLRNEA